ncbi:hypothetical protein [Actinomadura xylanilytica]|uniref:hypothetical protein n=1 Tax=Actinomadura xylanilytica TaxID=887459 RepID=UPI00255A9A10|nr:hypothetical protein [Actinomadura xylanilytica]MDL4774259.1 hypothetical protein [Actinomadura xylanilytica]
MVLRLIKPRTSPPPARLTCADVIFGRHNDARIRTVGRRRVCEYTATMTSASPSVILRPRLTRCIPPGRCKPPPSQSMTQNGADVHFAAPGMAGTISRAEHDSVPPELRGRWAGTAAGISVLPTPGMRRQFDIGAGTVGTEAIRITTTVNDLTCTSMALLISAENQIHLVPVRLLSDEPRCVLGGEQLLAPSGLGLQWEDAETGEGAALKRS